MRACTVARNPGFAAVSSAACLISGGDRATGAVLGVPVAPVVLLYV
jgi:hypothetical protein